MWQPSQEFIRIATDSDIVYTNAPLAKFTGKANQLPLWPETIALRNHIVRCFGLKQTYMPGRTRHMNKGDRLDMHQAGRAIDFMCSIAQGEQIANLCMMLIPACHIQFIVWDHMRFSAAKVGSERFGRYTGSNPHTDHVHVELAMSAKGAPWYANT